MSRTTYDLLTTACSNRGIDVNRVHKTRLVLRTLDGVVFIFRSIEAAWEGYKADPTLHNAPLLRPVEPIRY